jgi:hypothetical protein
MTANAGDLIDLTKVNLPVSSISVFVTGFIKEQVKHENEIFKTVKITVNEFVGGGTGGRNFVVKCRYLKTDQRIDRKVIKTRKNSCLMVTGELSFVDTEFLIDIQDVNFISMSSANIETTNDVTSSLYSWSTTTSSGRISAQSMANNMLHENSTNATQHNQSENTNDNDDLPINYQETTEDNEYSNETLVNTHTNRKKRKSRK